MGGGGDSPKALQYEGNLQLWQDIGKKSDTPGTLASKGAPDIQLPFGPPAPGPRDVGLVGWSAGWLVGWLAGG